MKASTKLIEALKGFEGCRLFAYRDSVGIATIGYGHIKGVRMGQAITQAEAEHLLREDLKVYECHINHLGVCKTQGQFDALVDFTFNLGCAALDSSTLLRYIKAGKPDADIQAQIKKWCHAGGKVLTGLVKRRAWEAKRWTEKD